MSAVAFSDDLTTLHVDDARSIVPGILDEHGTPDVVVLDPPYDDEALWEWSSTVALDAATRFVLCDPRTLGDVVARFGPCSWVFTWDTMTPWNLGPRRPLTQTKFALLYGELDGYHRDGALWGEAPPARDHPTTKTVPLDGRRLTDHYRESLRWLHHPAAGAAPGRSAGGRFERKGDPAYRHAKPLSWVRCLIGNTTAGGWVLDPFAGSGTTLVAARALRLRSIGVELDADVAASAVHRITGPPSDPDGQLSLLDEVHA